MNCPRCETTILTERDREGICIDLCETCRGIWLDRGELEKLISRETRERDEQWDRRESTPARGVRYDKDDDRYRRYPKQKRGWMESLGDLFD